MQQIEVKPTHGLNSDQIKDILLKSAKNAKEDITKRLLIEAKVGTQRNILAIVSALEKDSKLLSKKELLELDDQIKLVKKIIDLDDIGEIKKEAETLENLAKVLAERRMNKDIKKVIIGQKIDSL